MWKGHGKIESLKVVYIKNVEFNVETEFVKHALTDMTELTNLSLCDIF